MIPGELKNRMSLLRKTAIFGFEIKGAGKLSASCGRPIYNHHPP